MKLENKTKPDQWFSLTDNIPELNKIISNKTFAYYRRRKKKHKKRRGCLDKLEKNVRLIFQNEKKRLGMLKLIARGENMWFLNCNHIIALKC